MPPAVVYAEARQNVFRYKFTIFKVPALRAFRFLLNLLAIHLLAFHHVLDRNCHFAAGMKRREFLETLSHSATGRRFILNFAYCETAEIFLPEIDRAALLDELAGSVGAWPPNDVLAGLVNECIAMRYHAVMRNARVGVHAFRDHLFRVAPYSTFKRRDPFGLLSAEAFEESGVLDIDTLDPDHLRRFASEVLDHNWIATGAQVRGRHPFAWSTSEPLDAASRGASGTEHEAGKALCQLLALNGFVELEPIFLLKYPAGGTGVRVRRPTALDGWDNLFFKARIGADSLHGGPYRQSGYTLDLGKVNAAASVHPISECDGYPELAAEPVTLTPAFGLFWLGNFRANWTECDEHAVDTVISGSRDPKGAVTNAIDRLAML